MGVSIALGSRGDTVDVTGDDACAQKLEDLTASYGQPSEWITVGDVRMPVWRDPRPGQDLVCVSADRVLQVPQPEMNDLVVVFGSTAVMLGSMLDDAHWLNLVAALYPEYRCRFATEDEQLLWKQADRLAIEPWRWFPYPDWWILTERVRELAQRLLDPSAKPRMESRH